MRHFRSSERPINPITHLPSTFGVVSDPETSDPQTKKLAQRGSQINGFGNQLTRTQSTRFKGQYSSERVRRNPITGEGMKAEDYLDILKLPKEYTFRTRDAVPSKAPPNPPKPQETVPHKPKQAIHGARPKPKPQASSPGRSTRRRSTLQDVPEAAVKKVIRPKKHSTDQNLTASATEQAPIESSNDNPVPENQTTASEPSAEQADPGKDISDQSNIENCAKNNSSPENTEVDGSAAQADADATGDE